MRDVELRILFATNFSDACFRSIRAVAQIADAVRTELSLCHVYDSRKTSQLTAEQELTSFFAEADRYPACRRLLLEGDPAGKIAQLASTQNFDLVLAPQSSQFRPPRPFHQSFRARLLDGAPVPLWTASNSAEQDFPGRLRTIACLIDFESHETSHIRLAAGLARRLHTTLKLVHVVRPVHEGRLAEMLCSPVPLTEQVALGRIQKLAGDMHLLAETVVAVGSEGRTLRNTLREAQVDLLFVGPGKAVSAWPGGKSISSLVRRAPCPVICVDGAAAAFAGWNFHGEQRHLLPAAGTLAAAQVAS